jgi:hypothetical protein
MPHAETGDRAVCCPPCRPAEGVAGRGESGRVDPIGFPARPAGQEEEEPARTDTPRRPHRSSAQEAGQDGAEFVPAFTFQVATYLSPPK